MVLQKGRKGIKIDDVIRHISGQKKFLLSYLLIAFFVVGNWQKPISPFCPISLINRWRVLTMAQIIKTKKNNNIYSPDIVFFRGDIRERERCLFPAFSKKERNWILLIKTLFLLLLFALTLVGEVKLTITIKT